ncbi:acyl-CoA reductase [Robertkochia solimangrovi]|uniref:acyl-CoA reductase n=1 Tax=Robertkochia solimangrovi TaxID=2213046 RepID=UPI00117EC163|nr:acyl-CoA reductase [Robertkochia solimangrovi]TRZ45321.1 acyl-CoA reductase [Robertkochia solimangrovi]
MSDIHSRIEAFSKLGTFIKQFSTTAPVYDPEIPENETFFEGFEQKIQQTTVNNTWFTRENIRYALEGWSELLTAYNLKMWMSQYLLEDKEPKTIAIIMAGNIPMVGFHDLISVLITGNKVIAKLSSNDKFLLPYLMEYLQAIAPEFKEAIHFTEEKLEGYEAVIATGSNNTARYFEYYFGSKPNIIRKNRNSVAVLTGKETEEEMKALADDIFRYYGLGCRNVSKLFLPDDYDFDKFFNGIFHYKDIINEDKYANNYDYNKAVYLMSLFNILENGFLMLKEDTSYASPIATVFYEKYDNLNTLKNRLDSDRESIQCIVTGSGIEGAVDFGQSQRPGLSDYADGIDTVRFVLNL